MTDELQTLTRAEVDAAPVGTIVRTTRTTRCEVAIKIAPANRSSMGLWRTTNGSQFDFAIAQAGAVEMVPAATTLDAHPAPSMENLLDTPAGLALANAVWQEGASTMLRSVNEHKDGPWMKPASPYTTHPAPERATLVVDDVKMLRETLCVAQTATSGFPYTRIAEHIDRLQGLIDQLDGHRPLGPDGKHDDRHTPTCGCDGVPVSDTRREDAARARHGENSGDGATCGVCLDKVDARLEDERLGAKYRVERTSDPDGKHLDCGYFVLDPQHDPHAVTAIRAYSAAVRPESPALADDLDAWVAAPVSDTRREDVARARALRTADIWDEVGDPVIEAWNGGQFTTSDLRLLAAPPAPPVVDEAEIAALIRAHNAAPADELDARVGLKNGCACREPGTAVDHLAAAVAARLRGATR